MEALNMPGVSRVRLLKAFGLWAFAGCAAAAHGMTALSDADMAGVRGEGIAVAYQDFRFAMAGTDYIEFPATTTPPTITSSDGNSYSAKAADLRYFGLTISDGRGISSGGISNTNGGNDANAYGLFNWNGSPCTGAGYGTTANAACPVAGLIPMFAAYDNPFVLRVFNYATNANPDGSTSAAIAYNGSTFSALTSATPQTVLELLAPTVEDSVRVSSWIQLAGTSTSPPTASSFGNCKVNGSTDAHCYLKAQFMIYDDSINDTNGVSTLPSGNAGSVIRILQSSGAGFSGIDSTSGTAPQVGGAYSNPSFAIIGIWHLTGDFRFTVNQANTTGDGLNSTTLPVFGPREGLYFLGMNTYLPLGQMFYQAITFNGTPSGAGAGNFVLELTQLPNISAAYTDFYGMNSSSTNQGYTTTYSTPNYAGQYVNLTTGAASSSPGYNTSGSYNRTHGYVQLGTNLWAPASYTYAATGTDSNGAITGGYITGTASCVNIQGNCGATSANPAGTPPTCTSSTSCTTNDGMVMFSSSTSSTFPVYSYTQNQNVNTWVTDYNNNSTAPPVITNPNNGNYNVVNLGDSNVQGLLIQHLFYRTCSAGTSSTIC